MSISWDDIICDDEFRKENQDKVLGTSGSESRDNVYPVLEGVLLHHHILPPHPILVVDHHNGNKLDVRKINLRYLTHAENVFNTSKTRGYDITRQGKFIPCIVKDGKTYRRPAVSTVEKALEIRLELEEKFFPGIKYRG